MDYRTIRACKKSPSAGGMSRKQVDDLAREYGIDPSKFKRKDDLCDEIARIAQERGAPMIPVTPAPVARPAVIPTAVVPAVAPPTVVAPPPTGPITNIEIAQKLRDLGTRLEQEGDTYRARAFLNVARTVERFPVAITDPATQLRNTPRNWWRSHRSHPGVSYHREIGRTRRANSGCTDRKGQGN